MAIVRIDILLSITLLTGWAIINHLTVSTCTLRASSPEFESWPGQDVWTMKDVIVYIIFKFILVPEKVMLITYIYESKLKSQIIFFCY